MRLPFQESQESRGAKLFLRPVFCFEHAVGVEDTAIAGPEGKFQRGIRSSFHEPEQQAVGIDFAKRGLLAVYSSKHERRMPRTCVAENLLLRVQEHVRCGHEMLFEFATERTIQSGKDLRGIGC